MNSSYQINCAVFDLCVLRVCVVQASCLTTISILRMSYAQICTCSNRICVICSVVTHINTMYTIDALLKVQSSIQHPRNLQSYFVFRRNFFLTICPTRMHSALRSALSSSAASLLLNFMVFVAQFGWQWVRESAMFICFELLILCLCASMSKSHFQRFSHLSACVFAV